MIKLRNKPQTQIVPNKKKQQSKYCCGKSRSEKYDFYS